MKWLRWCLLLGALALALGNRGLRGLVRNYKELSRLKREMSRLRGEEKDLQTGMSRLRGDDSYLEGVARNKLGFVKKGELEYRFSPSPDRH